MYITFVCGYFHPQVKNQDAHGSQTFYKSITEVASFLISA